MPLRAPATSASPLGRVSRPTSTSPPLSATVAHMGTSAVTPNAGVRRSGELRRKRLPGLREHLATWVGRFLPLSPAVVTRRHHEPRRRATRSAAQRERATARRRRRQRRRGPRSPRCRTAARRRRGRSDEGRSCRGHVRHGHERDVSGESYGGVQEERREGWGGRGEVDVLHASALATRAAPHPWEAQLRTIHSIPASLLFHDVRTESNRLLVVPVVLVLVVARRTHRISRGREGLLRHARPAAGGGAGSAADAGGGDGDRRLSSAAPSEAHRRRPLGRCAQHPGGLFAAAAAVGAEARSVPAPAGARWRRLPREGMRSAAPGARR